MRKKQCRIVAIVASFLESQNEVDYNENYKKKKMNTVFIVMSVACSVGISGKL